MLLSDAPHLSIVNCGPKLRLAATRLQNMAAVAFAAANSGEPHADLIAFWKDQKSRVNQNSGHPADGLFLRGGVPDIRAQCYMALSFIRLNRSADKVAAWENFCDYFIMAADSLRNSRSAVVSMEATIVYPEGRNYYELLEGPTIHVAFLDAVGKLVPMSHDNPALGVYDIMYHDEGPKPMEWRKFNVRPTTNPYDIVRGAFSDRTTLGAHKLSLKYEADAGPIVLVLDYQRGPVTPPPAPPAGKSVVKNGESA